MAKQVVNNGETGGLVRGKLNDNFTELYDAVEGILDVIGGLSTITPFGASLLDDDDFLEALGTLSLDTHLATLTLPADTTISTFGKELVGQSSLVTVRQQLGFADALYDEDTTRPVFWAVFGNSQMVGGLGGTLPSDLEIPENENVFIWQATSQNSQTASWQRLNKEQVEIISGTGPGIGYCGKYGGNYQLTLWLIAADRHQRKTGRKIFVVPAWMTGKPSDNWNPLLQGDTISLTNAWAWAATAIKNARTALASGTTAVIGANYDIPYLDAVLFETCSGDAIWTMEPTDPLSVYLGLAADGRSIDDASEGYKDNMLAFIDAAINHPTLGGWAKSFHTRWYAVHNPNTTVTAALGIGDPPRTFFLDFDGNSRLIEASSELIFEIPSPPGGTGDEIGLTDPFHWNNRAYHVMGTVASNLILSDAAPSVRPRKAVAASGSLTDLSGDVEGHGYVLRNTLTTHDENRTISDGSLYGTLHDVEGVYTFSADANAFPYITGYKSSALLTNLSSVAAKPGSVLVLSDGNTYQANAQNITFGAVLPHISAAMVPTFEGVSGGVLTLTRGEMYISAPDIKSGSVVSNLGHYTAEIPYEGSVFETARTGTVTREYGFASNLSNADATHLTHYLMGGKVVPDGDFGLYQIDTLQHSLNATLTFRSGSIVMGGGDITGIDDLSAADIAFTSTLTSAAGSIALTLGDVIADTGLIRGLTLQSLGAIGILTHYQSNQTNYTSGIAHKFVTDGITPYSGTSKLASFENDGTEMIAIRHDGAFIGREASGVNPFIFKPDPSTADTSVFELGTIFGGGSLTWKESGVGTFGLGGTFLLQTEKGNNTNPAFILNAATNQSTASTPLLKLQNNEVDKVIFNVVGAPGFFGATPVTAQLTGGGRTNTPTTAGSGAITINSTSLWTGGVGSTGFSIGDCVRAFKDMGIFPA